MIVTIQNECLTVDIEDLGAQLASVRNHHGTEYQGKIGRAHV